MNNLQILMMGDRDKVLTLLDSDGTSYTDVWSDGTFIYVTDGTNGILSYSFDGSTLTLIDSDITVAGDYQCVYGYGGYIFIGGSNTAKICSYSVDGSGNLTFISSDISYGNMFSIYADANFVYVASISWGLITYTVDGSGNLTPVDTEIAYGLYGVTGDGTYIYGAGEDGLTVVYSVDGSGIITIEDFEDLGGTVDHRGISKTDAYLYVAAGTNGLRKYTVDGLGQLTYINRIVTGNMYGVSATDEEVYSVEYSSLGLRIYDLNDILKANYAGTQEGIFYDGNYIYTVSVSPSNSGLRVFSYI